MGKIVTVVSLVAGAVLLLLGVLESSPVVFILSIGPWIFGLSFGFGDQFWTKTWWKVTAFASLAVWLGLAAPLGQDPSAPSFLSLICGGMAGAFLMDILFSRDKV